MEKLTVQDAALKLGISKEAIHNRIRRGSLESVVEDDVKFVIIDEKTIVTKKRTTTNRQALNANDKRYYKLLEEQNEELKSKVNTLEDETRSLRDQKEQMLIDERKKIEQIHNDKDEQLKSILSSFSSKLLEAPQEIVEAEIEDDNESTKNNLISLRKYIKNRGFSDKKAKKIKDKFKKHAKTDSRIIIIGKKYYIDLTKHDYSDLSL
jgi:FtsZ-binding cell division protein ZapB